MRCVSCPVCVGQRQLSGVDSSLPPLCGFLHSLESVLLTEFSSFVLLKASIFLTIYLLLNAYIIQTVSCYIACVDPCQPKMCGPPILASQSS